MRQKYKILVLAQERALLINLLVFMILEFLDSKKRWQKEPGSQKSTGPGPRKSFLINLLVWIAASAAHGTQVISMKRNFNI